MSGLLMRVSEAATRIGAHVGRSDGEFTGVTIDSRRVEPGNLFVALSGERADGHDFVGAAEAAGAGAALVEREVETSLPLLTVADSQLGLGALARAWRENFNIPLVGITGSNGKTTVKEMLSAIVSRYMTTLVTQGNLNNELGVPLTLSRLDGSHKAAVVEMGASRVGDIRYLAEIAKPTVGVITQCAPAHLEGFGSVDGVAKGKGEMVESLPISGCAVLNADDHYIDYWRPRVSSSRTLTFGLSADAMVTCDWSQDADGLHLDLTFPEGCARADLPLLGKHNVMNALAAAAAAFALDLSAVDIARGLGTMTAVPGRLAMRTRDDGVRVIDDSYNANPTSLGAAIDVLKDFSGPRWLVLGDMAELGETSVELHRDAGERAISCGIERLFTTGQVSKAATDAFGPGGKHYEHFDALLNDVRNKVGDARVVLVKGSRSMRMERVVAALSEDM